ncbi:MAG: sigma-70 family RNA polymerase sigma factor, partial [Clostridia bacterium]|nr:sigma-70 family RNA polymerase sigma factor [Clostridia bacterium]
MEDKDTVLRAREGDKKAFERLVEQYSAGIYRLCLGLCGNGFDAEDAAQETFIDAFLYLKSLSDPDRFPAWLRSIAKRKSARILASRRYDEDVDALSDFLPSRDASPLDLLLSREKSGRVTEAFGHLSDKRRDVAELFYFRGLKVKEIAARLDLSENTVKSRLYDAREQLRKELSDMNTETTDNIKLLEEKIKNQLTVLSRYYPLHGGLYDDGFQTELDSALDLIESAEDGEAKESWLAEALSYKIYGDKNIGDDEKKALTERRKQAAKDGKNARVIADALIDEFFEMNDNDKKLEFFEKKALPEIETYIGSDTYAYAKGSLLFWRGRTLLELDRFDDARADFEEAVRLIDPSDAYHANAVAAIRTLDRFAQFADRRAGSGGGSVTGEGLLKDGTRMIFYNQPGFGFGRNMLRFPRYFDSFVYFASTCRRTLFDTAMEPGDTITDAENQATLGCVSKDERIKVKAGEFAGCLHMRTEAKLE